MDDTRERFVSEDEKKANPKNEYAEQTVDVGKTFEIARIIYRVRKVTIKDIICRPVNGVIRGLSVGNGFQFAGRMFRIRKITNKDIICRPVDWKQETQTSSDGTVKESVIENPETD